MLSVALLKGEGIVVVLALVDSPTSWTVRSIADRSGVPRSVVQRSLKRLAAAGLLDERRRRELIPQLEEFLTHGLRYVFPAVVRGEVRGVRTAWSAGPLVGQIASGDTLPLVWPRADGDVRGLALDPLHPAVGDAAERDPALGELLALVDAIRAGDVRVRGVAVDVLRERLDSSLVA